MNLHHDDVTLWHRHFLHHHRRLWLYIAIGTDGSNGLQEFIRHVDARNRTIIRHAKKQVSRLLVIRQVIGKGTNRLTKLVGIGCGDSTFNSVVLNVQQNCAYFVDGCHTQFID